MTKGNPLEMKHTLKTEWILGIGSGVVALAALGLGRAFGKISRSSIEEKLIVWAAALVLVVAGAFAIIHLSRAIGRSVARRTTIGTGASVRLITTGVGYIILDLRVAHGPRRVARSPPHRRGRRRHHLGRRRTAEPRQCLRRHRHARRSTVCRWRHDSHSFRCHRCARRTRARHRTDVRHRRNRRRHIAGAQLADARRGHRSTSSRCHANPITQAHTSSECRSDDFTTKLDDNGSAENDAPVAH